VLWAHASNAARLEQSFREIAELVKVRGRKEPQADVFKLVHDWLREEKNGRWLLVVDNADDAGALSAQVGDSQKSQADDGSGDSSNMRALQHPLRKYLPPSRHGCVLVTSRTRQAAMQLVEDSDIIKIKPMDDAAAQALLRKKLGDEGEKSGNNSDGDSNNDIAKLAAALDHMPLALVQAAAYIRQRTPRCSVQQYLEEYRQSDSSATSLLNQGAGHLRRDEAASNAILITWQISFDHIRSTKKSAAGLLSLMSFFDRQGIQEALLRGQSSAADDRFEDDVLALRDYSFVTVTRDASTFEMHSLVQLATRTWLEGEGQLDRWREQFISNLCAEMPTGEHANWEICQALFPHAKAALSQRPASQKSLKEWALLLYKAAWYADDMGQYEAAREMNQSALEAREKVLGREHPDTLTSMNNLASVLNSQGKYEEAEAMNRQTLATREKVLGREHPDTLTSVYCLAYLLAKQHMFEESLNLYKRACDGYSKVLGEHHLTTCACRQDYSEVLELQEQSPVVFSAAAPDKSVSAPTRKVSRLSRGLAHLGIGRLKYKKS
jgi:tetratricopeptide (TPR) repeat protein